MIFFTNIMTYKTLYQQTKHEFLLLRAGAVRHRTSTLPIGSFELEDVPEVKTGEFLRGIIQTLGKFGIGNSLNITKLNSKSPVHLINIAIAQEDGEFLYITKKGKKNTYKIKEHITRGAFNEIRYIVKKEHDDHEEDDDHEEHDDHEEQKGKLILRKSKLKTQFNNDIYENIIHIILYQYCQIILKDNPIIQPLKIAISTELPVVYCIMENGGITFSEYLQRISKLEEENSRKRNLVLEALESIYIRLETLSNVIGFVHGDFKPNNILCKYKPITFEITDVKFIDFGYSKFTIREKEETKFEFVTENALQISEKYDYNICKDMAFLILTSILMVKDEFIANIFREIGKHVIVDFENHSKKNIMNLYWQTYKCNSIDFDEIKLI